MHAPELIAAKATGSPIGARCKQAGEVLVVSGTIEASGLVGTFSRRVEIGTGRQRETRDLGVGTTGSGFDRRGAWGQDMSGGIHDLDSAFARPLAASMAWLDGQIACGGPAAGEMKLVATQKEGRKLFLVFRAAPPDGTPFELWRNARTGVLDRASFQMSESRLIRHYSDWRQLPNGALVPFIQRDEFPEDEDQTLTRISRVTLRKSKAEDFKRPLPWNDVSFRGGRSSTSVPFEDDHRTRIYIRVHLNGKGPFLFELDSGGHNILTSETAQAIGLSASGSMHSTGAGTTVTQSGIARLDQIQIGDAVIKNQPVSVRKLSGNDRSPRDARAGILGLEIFERFIVTIDAARKVVTLARFGTEKTHRGVALPITFAEDAPLVQGAYLRHPGEFMLDTGNAGPTIIEHHWASQRDLTSALSRGTKRGDAAVSTAALGIGPFTLGGELVSYYGPAERGSEYSRSVAGVYGQPLLSRFNVTYDYSRRMVWVEPLAEGAVSFDRSGIALAKQPGGFFQVTAIAPDSPAHEAGVKVGDLISQLNDVSATTFSRADAVAMLRAPAGTPVKLKGWFGGVEQVIQLRLLDLLR